MTKKKKKSTEEKTEQKIAKETKKNSEFRRQKKRKGAKRVRKEGVVRGFQEAKKYALIFDTKNFPDIFNPMSFL